MCDSSENKIILISNPSCRTILLPITFMLWLVEMNFDKPLDKANLPIVLLSYQHTWIPFANWTAGTIFLEIKCVHCTVHVQGFMIALYKYNVEVYSTALEVQDFPYFRLIKMLLTMQIKVRLFRQRCYMYAVTKLYYVHLLKVKRNPLTQQHQSVS